MLSCSTADENPVYKSYPERTRRHSLTIGNLVGFFGENFLHVEVAFKNLGFATANESMGVYRKGLETALQQFGIVSGLAVVNFATQDFGRGFSFVFHNKGISLRSYNDTFGNFSLHPRPFAIQHGAGRPSRFIRLPADEKGCDESDEYKRTLGGFIPLWRIIAGCLCFGLGMCLTARRGPCVIGFILVVGGGLFALAPWGKVNYKGQHYCSDKGWFHFSGIVPQKYLLTSANYWGTVIGIGRADMPNVLSTDKQVVVISALAEGSGDSCCISRPSRRRF